MLIKNILLLFVIKTFCLTETTSQTLIGCDQRCGNVIIPYPFGIGANCSAHDTYSITCNRSSNPPRPFITNINLEVLEISLAGTVRVNSPVFNSCKGTTNHLIVNFTNTPFTYSTTATRFTAFGCNNLALISGERMVIGGCISLCGEAMTSVPHTDCYGVVCCQTNIPPSLKFFNASLSTIESRYENDACKYAFMVDVVWFGNLIDMYLVQSMPTVPAVLDWRLSGNCSAFGQLDTDSNMTVCDSRAFCSNQSICSCSQGYQGNPYLPGGCQDIDECASSSTNKCEFSCTNTQGSYRCSCPNGYLVIGHSCLKIQPNNKWKTILIGCLSGFGVLLLLFVAWWVCKMMNKRKKDMLKDTFFKRNGGLLLQQQMSSGDNGNVEKTKLFTSKELEKATDHFNEDRIIGQGGQGTVYKGMLTDGKIVAIKRSKIKNESEIEQFINEVVILSQINHRNVVKLHGCCLETEVPLLVYEFITNGTLYDYIHANDQNDDFALTWEIRLRIATEIGGALSYLHSSAAMPIYHRDIKSTNILLDQKYRAKVADFGTSRTIAVDQTHLTTKVQGTFGYLDPEYFQSSQFTEKSDVYSFGVVLVELLTGEKPIASFRVSETRSLATYFLSAMKDDRLFEIVDPKIEGVEDQIKRFSDLANRCLNLDGRKRPRMKQVAIELELIRTCDESSPDVDVEVEDNKNIEEGGFWDELSTPIISSSSSSGSHPLLL